MKYTLRVTIPMREIVGGVVRYRDLVVKIKIAKFFSWRVCWWFAINCVRENFPLYGIAIDLIGPLLATSNGDKYTSVTLVISASGQKPLPCPTRVLLVLPCFSLSCFVGEKLNVYACAHSFIMHALHYTLYKFPHPCIHLSSQVWILWSGDFWSGPWVCGSGGDGAPWSRWNSASHCNSISPSNKRSHREIQPDSAVSTA